MVDEFVSAEFRDSVDDILSKAIRGIETANFEFPLLTSGDHVVEVLLNATTRRDAKDKVIGVVGIGQDGTFRCDPSDENNEAIRKATDNRHLNVVQYLCQIKNDDGTLRCS